MPFFATDNRGLTGSLFRRDAAIRCANCRKHFDFYGFSLKKLLERVYYQKIIF